MSEMNNPRKNRLLNCFDPDAQKYLINFCKRISSISADVFIIMARKASCFFDCLEELGLIQFDGFVTSERILDMNTDWLKDKDVVIIDDAIVSGTTIYKTIERLKKALVKSITVHVVTINKKWFQPELLRDNDNNDYLYPDCNIQPDVKCIEMCYNVVNAILVQPRPYDIDYPLTKPIKLKRDVFSQITNIIGWSTHDVTSSIQSKNNVFSLSIIPDVDTVQYISKTVGFDFNDDCFLKIRIYGLFNESRKEQYEIRIVPMVILNRLSVEDVDSIFNDLMRINNDSFIINCFCTHKSKLRFIQFYLAEELMRIWVKEINQYLQSTEKLVIEHSERNYSFLFPKPILYKIQSLCANDHKLSFNNKNYVADEAPDESSVIIDNPISLKMALTKPFLDFYINKELPCRKKVKELGKKLFEDDKQKEMRDRLEKGITFSGLKHILLNHKNDFDIHSTVSLFLDQAIDVGIAVPITEECNGTITRSYRHGEDVLFGKKEEILYNEMLYQFQENANLPSGLTRLTIEKLIVLYTKMGITQEFLTQYTDSYKSPAHDDSDKPCNILRVKSTLQGPVGLLADAQTHNKTKDIPYITDENKSMWLTSIFKELGIIIEQPSDSQEGQPSDLHNNILTVSKPDTNCIPSGELHKTLAFSRLLGMLFNKDIDTGINFTDKEIVKISSTLTLPITIQCLSAEVYIFHKLWAPFKLIGTNRDSDGNRIDKLIQSSVMESVNNAFMKMNSYNKHQAADIIKAVHFEDPLYQSNWNDLFPISENVAADNALEADVKKELYNLYNRQREWVYFANILSDLFVYALMNNYMKIYENSKYTSQSSRRRIKINDFLSTLNKGISSMTPTSRNEVSCIASLVDSIFKKTDKKEIIDNKLLYDIDREIGTYLRHLSNEILEKTRCTIGQYGLPVKNSIYPDCVCIAVEPVCDNEIIDIEKTIKKIYHRSEYNNSIIRLPSHYYPEFPSSKKIKYYWFLTRGNDDFETLTRFCLNIIYILKHRCKAILFQAIEYTNCIKTVESRPEEFLCRNFISFIGDIPYKLFTDIGQLGELQYIQLSERKDIDAFQKLMAEIDKNNIMIKQNPQVFENAQNLSINTMKYQLDNKIASKGWDIMNKKEIGVITVLPIETKAVNSQLGLERSEIKIGERLYYEGEIEIQGGSAKHRIVHTQQNNPGQGSVILAYRDMVEKYHPDFVFLVGIAGGIHDDVNYCDVVIGDQIISYDNIKDTPSGIKRRGQAFRTPTIFKAIIQALQQTALTAPLTAATNSISPTIGLHHGDIGSGSAVIANELSTIAQWLHTYNDKILAVETEAIGFNTAFYEDNLCKEPNVKGACVIRGISDLANQEKKTVTQYRIPAAENAAIVLKEMLKLIPNLVEDKNASFEE